LGGTERQQLLFVRYGRPGAALVSIVVFGTYELFSPSRHLEWLLVLLGVALVVSALGIVALRRWPVGVVARVTFAVDIPLIAGMVAVLDEPPLLSVPFFAPVAFAALMFGPPETLLTAAAAIAASVVVAQLIDASTLTWVADVLVLGVTGAILAGLSQEFRRTTTQLERELDIDAAALRISECLRSSLDLEDILTKSLEELARATDAARSVLRTAAPDFRMFQWHRPGLPPIEPPDLPRRIPRVIKTGERLLVRDRPDAVGDAQLEEFMDALGTRAMIAYPILWKGEPIAAVGLHDQRSRDWKRSAALLERVVPQLGAALVHARLYEQQQATLRMREELIANVSHELRTPLTSTIGFLQTLERSDIADDPRRRREFVALARQEAERLGRLVQELLDLARLERGIVPLELEELPLAPLVEEAAARIERQLLDGRSVRPNVDATVSARVDRERILQVLTNLIQNAALHGEGTITVTARDDGEHICLDVTDEGGGVDPEHVPDLFVPFARWSQSRHSSGLGLAIARRLAEAHGGTLEYRPPEDGVPHAFVLTLPR
jgi:signal transduction histidine kinase